MYIPKHFQGAKDADAMASFMEAHPFAVLIDHTAEGPAATHLPFVLEKRGESLVLVSHLARANPQAQRLQSGTFMVLFSGPHAYISPRWYQQAQNVPTWNYAALHAYGSVRLLTNTADQLKALVAFFTAFEPAYAVQWTSLSETYRNNMLKGIVAFEFVVERVDFKEKLSQNKRPEEQWEIARALLAEKDSNARLIGERMAARLADG